MKTFLLRELAFLAAPLFLLTSFRALRTHVIAVFLSFVLSYVFTMTLHTFVLYPVGWEAWIGVVIGTVASAFLTLFVMMFLA